MNLILFEAAELGRPLPRTDRRAVHILEVLRRQVGDTFDAAIINGVRGKAALQAITPDAVTLTFAGGDPVAREVSMTLLVGLPRPQTARDILRDATTLGVTALHFVRTEKSESSYAQSTLWSSGEWRRHIIAGAEQGFDPNLPDVTWHYTLLDALATLPPNANRLALDNYESTQRLSETPDMTDSVVLAVGGERGWSAHERSVLREHGFKLANLGRRVLRTETACIAALSILRAKLGLM